MLVLNRASGKTENIIISPGERGVSSVIFQTHGNAWNGALTLGTRVTGSGLPFVNCPYQQLAATLGNVNAGVTITGDGVYAVRTDGLDLQIAHAWTAGTVDIAVQVLDG
jgi:hypothetical protein